METPLLKIMPMNCHCFMFLTMASWNGCGHEILHRAQAKCYRGHGNLDQHSSDYLFTGTLYIFKNYWGPQRPFVSRGYICKYLLIRN